MKKMYDLLPRALALVLAFVLCVSLLPISAFAVENENEEQTNAVVEEPTTEETGTETAKPGVEVTVTYPTQDTESSDSEETEPAEDSDPTEPEPVASETEKFELDKAAILKDVEEELKKLTPSEEDGYQYDEETGAYTKDDGKIKTNISIAVSQKENSVIHTETKTETSAEQVTLDEGKEWVRPEGAVDVEGGFSYTEIGENGAKVVKTVTLNDDGSYTVTTETTTVKTITKTLKVPEDGKLTGTITLEVYEAIGLEGNGGQVTIETIEVTPDQTLDDGKNAKKNDLYGIYDRDGKPVVKTVKITANGIAVRKNGVGSTSNDDWSKTQLQAGDVVYVYQTKKDPTTGITWYRIGDNAWIDGGYSLEVRNDGSAGTEYKVTSAKLKICQANGKETTSYWVKGDKLIASESKVINGKLYYKCSGTNGKSLGWVLASGLKLSGATETSAYTEEQLNELLKDGNWDAAYFDETALESAIRIPCNNYNNGVAEIRILRGKDGKDYYVYCAQHGNADRNGYRYEIIDLSQEGNTTAMAAKMDIPEEDLQHIMDIAANGYWGVKDDQATAEAEFGSLAALKAKVLADGTKGMSEEEAKEFAAMLDSGLTDGVALSATQAAIWYYSSKGTALETNASDFSTWIEYIGKFYNTEVDPNGNQPLKVTNTVKTLAELAEKNPEEYNKIKALEAVYYWLLNADGTSTMRPEAITEDNFLKDVSIRVINPEVTKVEVSEDATNREVQQAAQKLSENPTYNTEVSFTMAVIPMENDDLIVTIYADGKPEPVKVVRLAGANGEDVLQHDGNGRYTIPDVELPSGATITLSLTGTQNMGRSVYVFSSEQKGSKTSQTFVGVSGKDEGRTINLSVNLTFNVDAAVEVEAEVRNYEVIPKNLDQKDKPNDPEEPETPPPGENPPPTTPEDPEDPNNPPPPDEELPEEELPLNELPDEELELDDPDIPLADVPDTGDISMTWYATAFVSACGLGSLVIFSKKREEQED